jgi:hypothetical protein
MMTDLSRLPGADRAFRSEPEKFRKSQTAERERAGLEKTAARKPVAEAARLAVEEGQHARPSVVGD